MSCHAQYKRDQKARLLAAALLAAASIVLFAADLSTGAAGLGSADVLRILFEGPNAEAPESLIVWMIRLPMSLTAFAVGAALALAGLAIQTITANPLASPSTLGITSGASFGAALAVSFGFSPAGELWLGTIAAAFLFALLISFFILMLGRLRGMTASTIILAGIIMNFFFTALQQFLQYRASPEVAQLIAGWTFGNLDRSSMLSAGAALSALGLALVWFCAHIWELTALSIGEERAQALGIRVERLRCLAFAASSILIAASVSFIGPVAFVGLVAPHCSRLLLGDDQRCLLPGSILFGGALMLLSSLASKWLSAGAALPVGIVTSLVGVPFLFVLLIRERGRT